MGRFFRIGYKKSLVMMVPGQVSSNITSGTAGPAGRWVVLPAPLAKSACQVRDSMPAFCLPDVMDVAWSPHDAWLASCSVDNTVVIWNAVKFPGLGLLWLAAEMGCHHQRCLSVSGAGWALLWLVAAGVSQWTGICGSCQ